MSVNEDAKKLTSKRTEKALADFSEAVIEADSASLASRAYSIPTYHCHESIFPLPGSPHKNTSYNMCNV